MSLELFLATLRAQKDKPYKAGAAGPNAFDAPGLVNFAYQAATGKTLGTLAEMVSGGTLDLHAQPGDLLFFSTKRKSKPDHVAVVLDDKRMIAADPTNGVALAKLTDPWYQERLVSTRHLTFPVVQPAPEPTPAQEPVKDPEPVVTPAETPALAFTFPSGSITTKRPNGKAYGIPWTAVSRWYDLLVQAAMEFAIDWRDLAVMIVIESDANHYTTGKTTGTRAEVIVRGSDGYDNVPAVGMGQVKIDYHQWRVKDADGYTPLGNLRLMAAIISAGVRQYGGVEKAITELYFPGDDAGSGTTQGTYLTIYRSLRAELDKNGSSPVVTKDPYEVIFGGVKTRVEYGWLGDVGLNYYAYGKGHGTTASTQHTGDDVLVPYGTKLYSPGSGVVDCVGEAGTPRWGQGCGAYNDYGDAGGGTKLGIGNITIMLDSGHKLTLGHCRTATVKVGQRVTQGQQVGTSGGMNGAHTHVEVSVLKDNTYWLVAPKPALIQSMSGAPVETRPLVQFAGAKVAVPLDVPFRIALIDPKQKNQRPGTKMTPDRYIQHETGNTNPGADAEMHRRYLVNGAEGQQLGYHFTVDGDEIVQMIPVDEITWHGGDGAGTCNSKGISCELCVEDNNRNKVKARQNAEKLAAAVMQAMGLGILEMHGDCCARIGNPSGCHVNCPQFIKADNYWPTFKANVQKYRDGSTINEPPQTYANPIAPPEWDGSDKVVNGVTFWALQRTYVTKADTPVYQYADVTSAQVRAPLTKGEAIQGSYLVQSKGELWVVTKYGSRVPLAALEVPFKLGV